MKYFLDLEPAEIEQYVISIGQSKYRAKQILKWVYNSRIESFQSCTDLGKELRDKLDAEFSVRSLRIKDKKTSLIDSAVRYTFVAGDNIEIPTVFMPQENRNSVCLSTQAGCSIGCRFCASGKIKFIRNLSRGELIEQMLQIEKDTGLKIDSVLFMGMGEPLLNYDNVVSMSRLLGDTNYFSYSRRHIILSTVGFVPEIRKLSAEKLGIRLALSLHAPDDETRAKFVSNRRVPYPVEEILKAGLEYGRITKSRLTIEYVMIPGVNDAIPAAKKLAGLIKKLSIRTDKIQINLIPFNPTDVDLKTGIRFSQDNVDVSVQQFKDYLMSQELLTIIRQSKGQDIGAACGQLIV
jgi:23S rRNA (adenine2503-C2)-methyltransferase